MDRLLSNIQVQMQLKVSKNCVMLIKSFKHFVGV